MDQFPEPDPLLERARKDAKRLRRAHAEGDPAARARVAAALPGFAGERLQLADAQHVVARELGRRSWPALVEAQRAAAPPSAAQRRCAASDRAALSASELGTAERLRRVRAAYRYATAGWQGDGPHEATLDAGAAYLPGEPVLVHVRRRGIRYELHDAGAAVRLARLAGPLPGWRDVGAQVEEDTAMNVSGSGEVGVLVVHGRDIPALALRVADASLALHRALLDAREQADFPATRAQR